MKEKVKWIVCAVVICITTSLISTGQVFASIGEDACQITVNGKTVATVSSQEEGEQVIARLKQKYYPQVQDNLSAKEEQIIAFQKPDEDYLDKDIETITQAVNDIDKEGIITFRKEKVVEVDEPILYETEVRYTKNMYLGDSKISQEGQNGVKHIVKRVVEINGELSDEKVITEKKTANPIKEIEYKGIKDPAEKLRKTVVKEAMKYLGTKYVWGGEDLKKGIDCSGFSMKIYEKLDYELPHYSQAQAECGTKVESLKEAKAGDLIIYKGHVAIYCGDGTIIHATPPKIICGTAADYTEILAIRRIIN